MLTEVEKEKIRQEEMYRSEVRKILNDKDGNKGKFKRFVDFLGSSLGLWILSATFLTFGVKIYEENKRMDTDRKETEEKVQKIDLELSYRFCRVLVDLYELTDKVLNKESLKNGISKDSVKNIALGLQNNQVKYSLYSEYSNYPFIALLAEQKRLLAHLKKEDPKLELILNDITGLQVFYEVRKVDYSDIRQIAGILEEEVLLERWKSNRFYFFDGSKDSPFP